MEFSTGFLACITQYTIVSISAITSELLSEGTAVFTGLLDGFMDVQFRW